MKISIARYPQQQLRQNPLTKKMAGIKLPTPPIWRNAEKQPTQKQLTTLKIEILTYTNTAPTH